MNTKQCTKCLKVKDVVEFAPHKYHKNGLQSHCRVCLRKTKRDSYALNPEKYRTAQKEAYAKDPEKYKSRFRRTFANNKEKYSEMYRQKEKNRSAYERAKTEGRLCSNCQWVITIARWKKGHRLCYNCEDAYQEALDLVMYLRQALLERDRSKEK